MLTSRKTPRVLPLTALALASALGLAACGGSDGKSGGGKAEVVASFYPMAWLAGKVGGDQASVQTLTKPGAEPHDLELTPRQIADVGKADLAVYVRGVQPAVDDAVGKHAKNKSLDAVAAVKTLPPPAEDEHGHEGEGEEGGHGEAELSFDPHVWLDPSRMATIATALGGKLAAADSKNAAAHKSRATALATELNKLDQEFKDGLKNCKQKTMVTSHAAFGYMAERYGLKQISIAGVDATNEPSPKRLAELTHEIKENKATTVFTETLVSPKVAEALARSAGVKTAVLDPIEGLKPGSSDDYLSVMRKNLQVLKPALGCS
ncbi:metal ABC transporter substrate-binding protein [Spirillospora sp. CA-294931]|uniref:metal ABC transporter substrate-binding protein n=1 Tax=Spirillospora sp. CA-294931 TaxID=3240042 RepID=UPI003D8ADE5A